MICFLLIFPRVRSNALTQVVRTHEERFEVFTDDFHRRTPRGSEVRCLPQTCSVILRSREAERRDHRPPARQDRPTARCRTLKQEATTYADGTGKPEAAATSTPRKRWPSSVERRQTSLVPGKQALIRLLVSPYIERIHNQYRQDTSVHSILHCHVRQPEADWSNQMMLCMDLANEKQEPTDLSNHQECPSSFSSPVAPPNELKQNLQPR